MGDGNRQAAARVRRRPEGESRARRPASRGALAALEDENRRLRQEVERHRRAEDLARRQAQMLVDSVELLAADPGIDRFLGHVLRVTVEQIDGVGGTLWFPDPVTGTVRLHLEYLDSRIIPAHESHHPAVLQPLPIGGRGVSTFPVEHAETYAMGGEVAGMPEVNRAYINSLGVRVLLTVPMVRGEETVGWICVRSRNDARAVEEMIPLAEALAGQATLAVHMARLSDQARHAAVLQERNRIARDIHDTLAQGFTGVVVNLEAANRALRKDRPDSAGNHIDLARSLAQSCLEEARQSVRALRPDALGRVDFGDALATQVKRLEASGAEAGLRISGERLSLPAEVEAELLRIVQECITNVLKHAGAGKVSVVLDYAADSLSLCVADDGCGFDPRASHDGFGLRGMRERAARIGASVDVVSGEAGTRVTARLPIAGSPRT